MYTIVGNPSEWSDTSLNLLINAQVIQRSGIKDAFGYCKNISIYVVLKYDESVNRYTHTDDMVFSWSNYDYAQQSNNPVIIVTKLNIFVIKFKCFVTTSSGGCAMINS